MTESIKIISAKEFLKKYKKPEQKKVWDNISEPWEEFRNKPVSIISDFLKDKKGLVVDFGCGNARNMIANNNLTYYGIDFSSKQIENAIFRTEKEHINAIFFQEDISKLNKEIFKDEMFDYGLFVATLHCLDTPQKREKALLEFYRILKRKGEAIITVWNSEDSRFNLVKNHGDIYMSWKKNGKTYYRYYYLYNKKEFISLIESVGFLIIEFYNNNSKDRFVRKNWIVHVKKE
ncbi:MAG: class I SAM-dependent methyltransferase [Candidatus Pacearchaeota archaeon]